MAARRRVVRLLAAALSGLAAFALVLAITDPLGPGLDPDALAYMGAAESVAAHLEYRVPTAQWTSADSTAPLAHFPPGFSTALAVPVRLGMTPPQGARLVEALAAFVTVGTLVFLVSGAAGTLVGLLFAVALFAMPPMHAVHASVLSEPLFLACLALTLAAMTLAPDRPLHMGIPAALGALTRYAGLSLVGAVAVWQLARRGPLTTRVRRALLAVAPAALLQGAWVLRTRLAGGGESSIRELGIYGDLAPTLRQGAATLRDWLIPDPGAFEVPLPHRGRIALAAGVLLLVLGASGARRARGISFARRAGDPSRPSEVDAWRLIRASALLGACYLGMIVVSRLVADANIPFDERILSPFLLLVMVVAATTLALWWRGGDARGALPRGVLAAALLAWWAASASVTLDEARDALDWGSDFAGQQWRSSELLRWARTSGAPEALYTNWPGPIYFYLHRPSRDLPARGDARALRAFVDTLRRRGGRVLAFSVPGVEYATAEQLVAEPGLRVVAKLADGVVLAPR